MQTRPAQQLPLTLRDLFIMSTQPPERTKQKYAKKKLIPRGPLNYDYEWEEDSFDDNIFKSTYNRNRVRESTRQLAEFLATTGPGTAAKNNIAFCKILGYF